MTALGTVLEGFADVEIDLDLDALVGSHAAVIANSGGGKSGLLRRILETTHGRIQHIVLDIEDEFYTLREQFDYVIAGGDGGDIPATVEGAAGLALAALTHGFSLIVQLNDLGEDAPEFVGRFLSALIGAPRDLWHPCLVVVDEVQHFAGTDRVTAATAGVKALTGKGRKRGFTAILASQRISKVSADVRGDLNNWMLGRVGQTLDRDIMADQLGFTRSQGRERLRMDSRTFWGFGPAIADEPVLFRVADVETTLVKSGQAKVPTPPAPEALRAILSGLVVAAPSQAEGSVCVSAQVSDLSVSDLIDALDRIDPEWIKTHPELLAAIAERNEARAKADEFDGRINAAIRALGVRPIDEVADEIEDRRWANGLQRARIPADAGIGGEDHVDRSAARAPVKPEAPAPAKARARSPELNTGVSTGPSPAATAIVDLLDRVNPARLTWQQAAAMTGRKASGGNFNSARKWVRESGRILEDADGQMIRSAKPDPVGMTRGQAIDLWKSVLTNPAPRMIDALDSCARPIGKDDLGALIGAVARGGNFNNGLAQLRRNGLLQDVNGGFRLAQPLPGEKA